MQAGGTSLSPRHSWRARTTASRTTTQILHIKYTHSDPDRIQSTVVVTTLINVDRLSYIVSRVSDQRGSALKNFLDPDKGVKFRKKLRICLRFPYVKPSRPTGFISEVLSSEF
jgi:hypothetical protein